MTDQPKRQRRDRRKSNPQPMRLTERDVAIIHAVHTHRVLRQDQLEDLFGRSSSVMQRVLVRLYHHGFLERKFLTVLTQNSPTLYVLDRKGADLLRAEYGLEDLVWYNTSKNLSLEFMEHTTAINDFRIAVTLAVQTAGYELVQWIGERELKADFDRVSIPSEANKPQSVSLIPDSYFVLKVPQGYAHFFVEIDRATESLPRFKTKIRAYVAYYKSGAYTKRYNTRSMRVLTITSGQKRLENLKKITEDAGGKRAFWFTTVKDVHSSSVLHAPLWYIAGETKQRSLIE